MGILNVLRIILQIIATLCLLASIGANVTAILTPSWQTVYLADLKQLHFHGLWMDCIEDFRKYNVILDNGGKPLMVNDNAIVHPKCSYKFDQDWRSNGDKQHQNLCKFDLI